MIKLFSLLVIFFNPLHAKTYTVFLGDTPVQIIQGTMQKRTSQPMAKTLVHVHENEITALAAATKYVHHEGGTLITLKHGGTRNIVFHLDNVRYEVDPNRIFTDHGIKLTLHQFGHYSKAAHREVRSLAKQIVALIPPGKVIAVHNNRDYSLKEYFPNQSMHSDAKAVYYLKDSNYRNFYFVTKPNEFQRLKMLNYNVALQAPTVRDDGSLSYYLGKRDYVNIEAGYGELKAQLSMLYHA
ncbi:MAG: hypothetical protein A3F46_07125 [Legionellales bacterium RIFCSPHIGHO2_12_FULL_42_9]|nr:MAG: hypothetical protein A3F46_07125 [Legionellales bacterium RIFCSPHIGHO2_12_FULL_42_9]